MTENDGRRIDTLVGAVGELNGTVRALMNQWAVQEQYAAEGRQIIQDKMEGLTREVGNITANVLVVTRDVADLRTKVDTKITPTIDEYKFAAAKLDGRRDGVLWASRLFWTGIVAIAGAVAFAVSKMLDLFGHSGSGH